MAGRASGGSAGSAAGGMGGFGGTGGGVQCPPGTPFGTVCCSEERDCSDPDFPFCAAGRCVECVPERDNQPARGCAPNEVCDPSFDFCFPHCATDDECGEQGHCDAERNVCVQCTSDEHCNNSRYPHCETELGFCVECTSSRDCEGNKKHPICSGHRCVECASSDDCVADPGRTVCSLTDQVPNVCVECTRNQDTACEKKGQVCNDQFMSCVDCVSSQQCEYPTSICRQDNRCVECLSSEHCTDPAAPICRPDGHCDGCVSNQECGQNGQCNEGRCVNRP